MVANRGGLRKSTGRGLREVDRITQTPGGGAEARNPTGPGAGVNRKGPTAGTNHGPSPPARLEQPAALAAGGVGWGELPGAWGLRGSAAVDWGKREGSGWGECETR